MANLLVLDGDEQQKYLKATGAGTNGDPHVTQNAVTGVDVVDAAVASNPVVFAGVVSPTAVDSGDVQYVSVDADGRLVVTGSVTVTTSSTTVTVGGTVAATQSGTWDVGDVTGTVSLPTGASTLSEQQTQTTALQLIDDAVSTTGSAVPAKGFQFTGSDGTNARAVKTDASGELQVDVLTLPALASGSNTIGVVTANAGSGNFATNVTQYGGSNVGAGNAVHVQPGTSAVFPISDNGGTITVDGAVAATQSGTWNVTDVSGTVSLPTGASTLAEQQSQTTALELIDDGVGAYDSPLPDAAFLVGGSDGTNLRAIKTDASGELQVDVLTLPSLPAGSNALGSVSATVTGTPTVAVSGTVAVTDNSGSLTVDAPVATPVFVRLSDGSSAISTLAVSLASVPSHAVTNAGTFAVQASQSGAWNVANVSGTVSLPTGASTLAEQQTQTTSLQTLDDPVATVGTTPVFRTALYDDADNQITSFGAGVQYTEGDTDASVTGTAAMWRDGDDSLRVASTSHPLPVEVTNTGLAVFGATTYTEGTNRGYVVGAVRRDADTTLVDTTNEIAPLQVDANGRLKVEAFSGETLPVSLASVPSHAVTNAGTFAVQAAQSGTWNVGTVTTVTTLSTLTGGGVAHDAADSGNPIKVGAKVETSPKGITLCSDGDRTDLYADADGVQLVKLNTSNADLISESVSNTNGTSTAFTNFSAVSNTYNYVTAYSVFRTDAGTTPIYVDFRSGTGGAVLWSVVIPPNSGANLASPVPLFRTAANTALAFDVSAATSTVYISVSGFQSKV
jgi:hypothetical protein